MISKAINLSITLFVLIMLASCDGKGDVTQKETTHDPEQMGMIVPELPASTWSVFQDLKGNYWFGSNGLGVYVYDGTNLIWYTKDNGLVASQIRGIQGDQEGNVFIQTPAGVSKYDGHTFTTLEIVDSQQNEWKLEPDDLWFNCNGNPNDVYRYDGQKLIELQLPRQDLKAAFGRQVVGLGFEGMNSSPYSVFGIDKDSEGNLWVGTVVAGAFRYDGESFLWVAEKELSTLPDGRVPGVRSMIEDKEGYMWLSNFISKYQITENDFSATYQRLEGMDMSAPHFADRIGYFNSGLSARNGDLWMTTYGGGAWKYDGERLQNFPIMDGATEVLLISVYEDNAGTIWLGTDNAGVFKFNGETFEKFEPSVGK